MRHNGIYVFVAVIMLAVLSLVAFLFYMLTSPDYRMRW